MKDISEAEVLQALQDAIGGGECEDGMTPTDAFNMLNDAGHIIPLNGVRALFRQLIESGKAKMVTVERQRWDGVVYRPRGIQFLGNGK